MTTVSGGMLALSVAKVTMAFLKLYLELYIVDIFRKPLGLKLPAQLPITSIVI